MKRLGAVSGRYQQPRPEPLSDAFYGLAGAFVGLNRPCTEADDAAVLIQFLTAFGSAVGRTAFFAVGEDRHYANLFTTLVGKTSKGRKGVSWRIVRWLFGIAEPSWVEKRIMSGLSTGEGLIHAVRDREEEIDEESGETKKTIDLGVDDKRLLVVEEELAKVLKVCDRPGNTLSPVIRLAWDGEPLMIMTKANAERATDAHTSIIVHITEPELKRLLSTTEQANGFANRFLWMYVKRSKALAIPPRVDEKSLAEIAAQVKDSLDFAAQIEEVRMTPEAVSQWKLVYPALSTEKTGLAGAIHGRAEAQAVRLALIFALLDKSRLIKEFHLRAALDVCRYAEESVLHIFGDAVGDPLADSIRDNLMIQKQLGNEWVSRTAISKHLHHNASKPEVDRALQLLVDAGLAQCEVKGPGPDGGAPTELWRYAGRVRMNEINERTFRAAGD